MTLKKLKKLAKSSNVKDALSTAVYFYLNSQDKIPKPDPAKTKKDEMDFFRQDKVL